MNARTHTQIHNEIERLTHVVKDGFSFLSKDVDQSCRDYVQEIQNGLDRIKELSLLYEEGELSHCCNAPIDVEKYCSECAYEL